MSNILSPVPKSLVAGDSLSLAFSEAANDFPVGDGWAVSFVLSPVSGGTPVPTVATGGAESWHVVVNSTTTSGLDIGAWNWALQAVLAGQRTTIDRGEIDILADPSLPNVDTRSQARRVLDAIDATIEGRASSSHLEVEFEDGRRIKHVEHSELMKLRSEYATKVAAEKRGNRGPAKILARL